MTRGATALVLALGLCAAASAGEAKPVRPNSAGEAKPVRPNSAGEAKPVRPNVVMVVADDQRWDVLGAAGNRTIVTPAMDRLAREGVYFRQATVLAPQCTPSRVTLLTGLTAHQHARPSNLARPVGAPSAKDLPMLPRALQAAGYRTVLVGKWHADLPPADAGFADVRTWTMLGKDLYEKPVGLVRGPDANAVSAAGYTNEIFGDDAVAFLESEAASSRPFFLWLALTAPHAPFEPNPPDVARLYEGKDERALWPPGLPRDAEPHQLRAYCEAVTMADRQLGRVLDALDRRKLADRTLVLFLSDNGLMLGSRDVGTQEKKAFQGKGYPYEASVRVPILVRGPGLGRGKVDDHAVSTLDLPPTIAAAAGVARDERWSGRDLGPILRGDRRAGPEDAFVELADVPRRGVPAVEYRAVRTPTHKLVVWREPRGPELYDLVADPDERRNLIGDAAAAATRRDLAKRLRHWLETTDDPARRWKSVAEPAS